MILHFFRGSSTRPSCAVRRRIKKFVPKVNQLYIEGEKFTAIKSQYYSLYTYTEERQCCKIKNKLVILIYSVKLRKQRLRNCNINDYKENLNIYNFINYNYNNQTEFFPVDINYLFLQHFWDFLSVL